MSADGTHAEKRACTRAEEGGEGGGGAFQCMLNWLALGIEVSLVAGPQVLAALLQHLAVQIAEYMCFQIEAGADCVQLFDSWGGQLPPTVSPRPLASSPLKSLSAAP